MSQHHGIGYVYAAFAPVTLPSAPHAPPVFRMLGEKPADAVVHHGGAGTTTTAAASGAPQVVVPQTFDQFYLAGRVDELGIGSAHPFGEVIADSLRAALGHALDVDVAKQARTVTRQVRTDGAVTAAG
ncbi:nucleotide disphospho-sugar-binding domain-containing protein [Streptomyces sp. NPDC058371]|uniref:nucleotide disphospho-sugar-binding domain-containing protein n=1 Tax=Streptomyces sp. NPDC058371 TaxID=3346463 RepID=UPI0036624DFF